MLQNDRTNLINRQTSSDPEELREFEPMADHGPKWVYLIGMWLFFGYWFVHSVIALIVICSFQWHGGPVALVLIAFVVLSAAVLFSVTRRFVRLRAMMY